MSHLFFVRALLVFGALFSIKALGSPSLDVRDRLGMPVHLTITVR